MRSEATKAKWYSLTEFLNLRDVRDKENRRLRPASILPIVPLHYLLPTWQLNKPR